MAGATAGSCDLMTASLPRLDLETGAVQPDDLEPGIKFLLPGIVDIHGDAFERHITPRPGTRFPLDLALASNDHSLTGAGITSFFLQHYRWLRTKYPLTCNGSRVAGSY
jgi:alpha-D-ribose 1-methylphosphonate 5-triphosphate diphosphatase PhnM